MHMTIHSKGTMNGTPFVRILYNWLATSIVYFKSLLYIILLLIGKRKDISLIKPCNLITQTIHNQNGG